MGWAGGAIVRRRVTLAAAAMAACVALRLLPYVIPVHAADLTRATQSIEFTDRSGLPLGLVLSRDQEHSASAPLDRISPHFLHAIVAAEDGRFYERGPVDARSLARAAWQTVETRQVVSGGSTIPMQLARMVLGLPSTYAGKVEQIWGAWRIAAGMDRDQILEAYVNRLPMGGNIYGVEAAARTYFGAPAASLDLAQASLLAAIPNDPSRLNPLAGLAALRARQRYVLDRMVADGYASRADAKRAANEEVAISSPRRSLIAAPHFLFWLASRAPHEAVVRTTIDRPLQEFVEEQVRQVMHGLAARNVRNAAAVVLDNATGQVLAYVGSADYFDDANGGRNDGVQALRQPGSTLKPFLYEQALETRAIRSNTILPDVPVHYALPGNLLYSPTDYSATYAGPVRVRVALADSLNVPAVRVLERVTVPIFLDRLRALGFAHLDKDADYYGLGLTLGGGEVSLWELARAYSTIARRGRQLESSAVMFDAGSATNGATTKSDDGRIGATSSWDLITDILADAHARARAFGVNSALSLPFPAAVKTGTSSDFRDTWTVGYTPDYTVAVWVGNFDGEPMRRVSGVAGAAPLWNRIMLHLYERREPVPFGPPEGLVLRAICSTTGLRPDRSCPSVVSEYLDPDDLAAYDKPVTPQRLPREYDQWLASQPATLSAPAFRIVRPQDGAYFIVTTAGADPGYSPPQRLEFIAAGAREASIRWFLNGRPVGLTRRGEGFFWPLQPGSYTLVAEATNMRDTVRFEVAPQIGGARRRGFALRPSHF